MIVGSFGKVVFEVSSLKVLTFDDFKRKSSAKFASHDVIARKPVLEFTGAELETVSLSIKLFSILGTNVEETTFILRDMCLRGEPNFLIIGNTVYGENEFVIESIDEKIDHWTNNAAPLSNELNLTLKEYVPHGD